MCNTEVALWTVTKFKTDACCLTSVHAQMTAVLDYPKWPLQQWLVDPIERALAVFANRKVEDTFDGFLALCEVSISLVSEGCRSSLGFPA